MSYRPDALERVGSALTIADRQVRADLGRFKELIEGRGAESGAWRRRGHRGGPESIKPREERNRRTVVVKGAEKFSSRSSAAAGGRRSARDRKPLL